MTSFVQELLRDTSHLCLHCTVRQLEQRVKTILDSIAVSDDRKRELIRGDAVDKAEQLSMFDSECVVCGRHVYVYELRWQHIIMAMQ